MDFNTIPPKNILVGQSGGPTAVINSSLYGVITAGKRHHDSIGTIYGMVNGIEGFLSDKYENLSQTLSEDDLELLKNTPAAYLGSCRYKLPEDLTDRVYPELFAKLSRLDIGYFFYIGGNDSMDTVSKLSRYAKTAGSAIKILGIPKTIDNDLVETDHTPGFGSAAKYVAATAREITLDSSVYHNKSVTIIELMGRHAGWITAASILARKHVDDNPVLIYLPEAPFDIEGFAADIEAAFMRKKNLVVCVSEGIQDKDGTFICEYGNEVGTDTFGHKMLTGCGKVLENFIRERFGVKVRSVEVNVSQRCSGRLASQTDIAEAAYAGSFGVQAALEGASGAMIGFHRVCEEPYQIGCHLVDVDLVCNREKCFPQEWITAGGRDIAPEFLQYVKPLIIGEPDLKMVDGLPEYCYYKG